MKLTVFTGVGTALVTPFDSRGEVLWEELEKLIELQISGGADAIIACGTTGEAATMSSEEHLKVIAFIIERVKDGKFDIFLACATGILNDAILQ